MRTAKLCPKCAGPLQAIPLVYTQAYCCARCRAVVASGPDRAPVLDELRALGQKDRVLELRRAA